MSCRPTSGPVLCGECLATIIKVQLAFLGILPCSEECCDIELWCSLIRAYGAVFKAVHKESGQLLAIKQVPVDSDLQDIIKEISIMQQCDR